MEETNKTTSVTFLWTVIDSIKGLDLLVPCLVRSDEKKYVSFRIIHQVVFSLVDKNHYRQEMFKSFVSSVQNYPCTSDEITILNEINSLHTSQLYGNELFADGELMCLFDELLIFYNARLKETIIMKKLDSETSPTTAAKTHKKSETKQVFKNIPCVSQPKPDLNQLPPNKNQVFTFNSKYFFFLVKHFLNLYLNQFIK